MACAYAHRWTWPLVAGGALLGLPTLPWAVVAGLGLALAFGSQLDRRRRQPVGALIGVLAAQALLRLPPTIAFGVPSLIAVAAPLPAVGSALYALRSRTRRSVLVGVGAATGAAVVIVVMFGIGLLMVRSDARTGVQQARSGLDRLRAGDEVAASEHFRAAADAFQDANGVAGAWWMTPARVVPVLSQHVRATKVVTAEGRRLAEVSAATAPAVSLDELTGAGGRFRVDRIVELTPLADQVVDTLERSDDVLVDLSTDWLSGPMAGAVDELRAEIADSLPDARNAVQALSVAPRLLGGDAPRNYVVLLANPAEARAMGGFVGSVGVLTADDGRLDFRSLDTPTVIEAALQAAGLDPPRNIPREYAAAQPHRFVRNWTDSPDIQTVADTVVELAPEVVDLDVDGVLYLDPYVVAALLELTGPVLIPETDDELTPGNAVDHLLREQYLDEAFQEGDDRMAGLGDAGEIAFDRLTSGGFPGPRRMADLLSPLVRGRRLLFTTTDPAAHALLERVGLRPPIDTGSGETLLVTHGNRRPGKLDAYLERSIRYDAEVRADGATTATVRIELTNTAPVDGLVEYQTGRPRPGREEPLTTNDIDLGVYSALETRDVLVDGVPAPSDLSAAHGLQLTSIPVSVPARETVAVEVRLEGSLDPARCRFTFLPNAGATADSIESSIVTPTRTLSVPPQVLDRTTVTSCAS